MAIFIVDALTKDKMINNIDKIMNGNPSSNDYSRAAMYYYEEDIDIKKAPGTGYKPFIFPIILSALLVQSIKPSIF